VYPEAISDPIWGLLRRLNSIPDMKSCYLGGGTALALQLGHRKSDDLDFFVCDQVDAVLITNTEWLEIAVINQGPRHTELMIQSIKVDFIREQRPLKFPLKLVDNRMQNLLMADARDIGRMKLLSIGSRGSKKDFVDLYCLTREKILLETLITAAMEEDHGVRYSKLLFLKGLVDFEEAEHEPELSMIWNVSWEEVKRSLAEKVKEIAGKIQQETIP
jgi:hypothetical protein